MFGAFKPTACLSGGLLWKIPWRLSSPQKLRHRRRLRRVDNIVSVLDNALKRRAGTPLIASSSPSSSTSTTPAPEQPGSKREVKRAAEAAKLGTVAALERWKATMPTEQEMLPRDKYTIFDKKVRGYRKGIHKLPKWTRVSQRVNPPGF